MDELTHYIITYYGHLMTPVELKVWRSVIGQAKIQQSESERIKARLRSVFLSQDPEVLDLLMDGEETFLTRVRDRILREHPDQVFLNECPRCGALARTPKAKQCPKCFHSWRADQNA